MVCWDLACALIELGHKVLLVAPKGSKVPQKGFLIETPEPALRVQTDWLEAERRMYEVYKEYLKDFDGIVHGHGWFGFEFILKANFPDVKTAHTHHGGLLWRSKPPGVTRLNLVAISNWMKRVYESQGWIAKFVYNGIDTSRYEFKEEKEERLLFVGRISKLKRPDVAIEVAKRAEMKLDVVGGTFVESQEYVRQIKHLCEVNGFGFYPDAPHEKKLELMQEAKATLFVPSFGEPFGLVAIESLCVGTPVIATCDGAIPEIVKDKEVGFVCSSVDEMVNATKKLDLIKPTACRRWAENFSRENMAQSYIHLYTEILQGNEW